MIDRNIIEMFAEWLLTAIVGIFVSVPISIQSSTTHERFYSAGVVEFRPSNEYNLEHRMLDNLKGYLAVLESEEAKKLDVIVFPEGTLNNDDHATFVPSPVKEVIVPCEVESTVYHIALVQLSCAAKKLSVYLVINLTEKERCDAVPEDTRPCAGTGFNLYNTNVVFDRKGAVVSRYRKINLYGENKNTTFKPEMGWFDTDFGIRFGHFICFDILFYEPAQALVVHEGITDFLFPTMWFSQLPFLTAIQVHQAWSYANNVNFLAAGSSNPMIGSTGTGIYNGRNGIIVAKMNQEIGERKLYVAQVPKYRSLSKRSVSAPYTKAITRRLSASHISLKRDLPESYQTIALNLTTTTSLKHEMCFSNSLFCCVFEVKWQPLKLHAGNKHYHYRLGVYDGWRNEEAAEMNQIKNCALFSCIGEDILDCGKVSDIDSDVVFENITITANFPKAERFLLMPNSLNASIMPLSVNNFQWQEIHKKNILQVRYELNTTTANVMAFSIYGNYYDCIVDNKSDDDYVQGSTAASLTLSLVLQMVLMLIKVTSCMIPYSKTHKII